MINKNYKQSKKIRGILHHIEINVSDLKKSIDFWGWLMTELGYKKYQEWEHGISYKSFDTYLVFVQTETKYLDVAYHRKRTGLNHLAFYVESRTVVDEFTAKLEKRKIKILYKDKHPFAGGKDYYAVYFEDPDRIKVELAAANE